MNKDGQPDNFIVLKPRKSTLIAELKIENSSDVEAKITEAEFDTLEYDNKWKRYRLRLTKKDFDKKKDVMQELLALAFQNSR